MLIGLSRQAGDPFSRVPPLAGVEPRENNKVLLASCFSSLSLESFGKDNDGTRDW